MRSAGDARFLALHTLAQLRGNLDIIERRLRQIGSTVQPEEADAGIIIRQARHLKFYLGELEQAQKRNNQEGRKDHDDSA